MFLQQIKYINIRVLGNLMMGVLGIGNECRCFQERNFLSDLLNKCMNKQQLALLNVYSQILQLATHYAGKNYSFDFLVTSNQLDEFFLSSADH